MYLSKYIRRCDFMDNMNTMDFNQKIDVSLRASLEATPVERNASDDLSTGSSSDGFWNLIVLYTGSPQTLQNEFPSSSFTFLLGNYAIVKISEDDIPSLAAFPQVIYIERPRQLFFEIVSARQASCLSAIQENSSYGLTGKGILISVIDSGIDYVTGIDIAGSVNLVEEDEDILPIFQDMTGHGTGIASIIAANGENDIKGINPDVELYSVKILDKENSATLSRVIRGIYWCIENNINIINMSFGTNVYSAALEQAVKDAYDAGILMIGAAGNEGESVEYPAAFEEVMAVAATDEEANISDFSNRGDELEIAAPGEKVKVSGFFDGTSVTHGTSIAVPHVVGVASLVWEKDLNKSSEFVRQLIEQSAKQIDNINECGLLDAENTLKNYEEFEKIFDEEQGKASRRLEENQQAPERFEEISEDQAYVEGRWHGTDHQAAVDKGAVGFTTEAITNIKKGIVYPDGKASGWQSGQDNSRWHGKWEDFNDNYEINYVAACDMVTYTATNDGAVDTDFTYEDYPGLSKKVYNDLKKDINGLQSKYSTLLTTDTPENRKYFLYGCGLHIITDAFAHSTTKKDGTIIGHSYNNGTYPDKTSYHHRRYQTAVKVVEYALKSLQDDIYCDGEEVVKALKQIYTDEATYKMIKIKKYVNDNGYSNAILSKVNIDTPKIP